MPITPSFFSTPQVAKLIGVSRIAVFKQIKAGRIKAMRVGKNYLVDKAEVLTLIRLYLKKDRKRLRRKRGRNIDSITG